METCWEKAYREANGIWSFYPIKNDDFGLFNKSHKEQICGILLGLRSGVWKHVQIPMPKGKGTNVLNVVYLPQKND